MAKKKATKKPVKKFSLHVNGFECQDTGGRTEDGCYVCVDSNSTYWVYNPETGEVRKQ